MAPEVQSLAALAVVAITAVWFLVRALAKRKHPGCGSDCGCSSQKFSAQIKR
jgi:hypothetical protein